MGPLSARFRTARKAARRADGGTGQAAPSARVLAPGDLRCGLAPPAQVHAAGEHVPDNHALASHPLLAELGVQAPCNLSLLSEKVHDYSTGERTWRAATDAERAAIADFRTDYVESIITESEDDELLERYFDGDELAVDEVVNDLMKALYLGSFHPVIPVLTNGVSTEELIGVIDRGFPTSLRWKPPTIIDEAGELAELDSVDAAGALLAEVIRTTQDPYAGRLS